MTRLLAIWRDFAECGNRKALRLKAQGVYSCKWWGLNVDNNAASAAFCNSLQGRYSCIAQGASPGLSIDIHFLSPKGAAQPQSKCPNTRAVSAAPTELILFLSVNTQGSISGFALISPWALQGCRAYGTHNAPEFWCACPASKAIIYLLEGLQISKSMK